MTDRSTCAQRRARPPRWQSVSMDKLFAKEWRRQSVGNEDRVEKSYAGPTRVARRKRASARRPIDSTGGPADTLLRQFRGPIA